VLEGDDNQIAYNQINGSDACSFDYAAMARRLRCTAASATIFTTTPPQTTARLPS